MLDTFDTIMVARLGERAVQVAKRSLEDIADQRAFAGTRDARHADEKTQGESMSIPFRLLCAAFTRRIRSPGVLRSLGIAIALVPAR